ncbi:antitoxin Xre/MbcA/ParS toxin-binding domain-containing protein [Anaerosolibacter carboniphilus]|nr:antitoxin Xre/MbcA/ParS toxin-binding domain-containing protein [Anaerosolibacter carboniphilus]
MKRRNGLYKQDMMTNIVGSDRSNGVDRQIGDYLDNYYDDWIDTPIPALDGQTPREAAKSSEGKRMLEDLFDYMHHLPNTVPFPYEKMKEELRI